MKRERGETGLDEAVEVDPDRLVPEALDGTTARLLDLLGQVDAVVEGLEEVTPEARAGMVTHMARVARALREDTERRTPAPPPKRAKVETDGAFVEGSTLRFLPATLVQSALSFLDVGDFRAVARVRCFREGAARAVYDKAVEEASLVRLRRAGVTTCPPLSDRAWASLGVWRGAVRCYEACGFAADEDFSTKALQEEGLRELAARHAPPGRAVETFVNGYLLVLARHPDAAQTAAGRPSLRGLSRALKQFLEHGEEEDEAEPWSEFDDVSENDAVKRRLDGTLFPEFLVSAIDVAVSRGRVDLVVNLGGVLNEFKYCLIEGPRWDAAIRSSIQGRTRVIRRRFNVGVLEASSKRTASTL